MIHLGGARAFETDFQETLKSKKMEFEDQDSDDVKRVWFLYARLETAIQKTSKRLNQMTLNLAVKNFLDAMKMKYEDFELHDELHENIQDMMRPNERKDSRFLKRLQRYTPEDANEDQLVTKLKRFIVEMEALQRYHAVPARDKEHEKQRMDMYPFDPSTDSELIALARALIRSYENVVNSLGNSDLQDGGDEERKLSKTKSDMQKAGEIGETTYNPFDAHLYAFGVTTRQIQRQSA